MFNQQHKLYQQLQSYPHLQPKFPVPINQKQSRPITQEFQKNQNFKYDFQLNDFSNKHIIFF